MYSNKIKLDLSDNSMYPPARRWFNVRWANLITRLNVRCFSPERIYDCLNRRLALVMYYIVVHVSELPGIASAALASVEFGVPSGPMVYS